MLGYHFTDHTLHGGAVIPPVGVWLNYEGGYISEERGLQAFEHPYDALMSAEGCLLHFVKLEGELLQGIYRGGWVGRRRLIVKTIDATSILDEFARWCALQAIHHWDAPKEVYRCLETNDPDIRDKKEDLFHRLIWYDLLIVLVVLYLLF